MEEAQPSITDTELGDAYRVAEAELPIGWRLDGLRCQSSGLQRDERSDDWRAVATGPDGAVLEGRAARPADALTDLLRQLRRVTTEPSS